uniref:Inosine/uridine-preferring nucleoside hydrolase domain-containing protein n=1 Tax=Alexandrium monilatum TaxID=311494 RepID=A0A7S4RLG7_9DINO|mmetsp:Transcript_18428/g.58490  ORF Transcript_18428/g.58490 Transcript_18428/m.58490 type:complete len:385 (-) Transcript_18428:65-1219(-)
MRRWGSTQRWLRGLAISIGVAAAVPEEGPSKRQKVIIVADVGVDDAAGLLWALANEKLEVLGVTASFGCHWDVRRTAANARTVLRSAGREDVPVFVGSRWAFGQSASPRLDGSLFHGPDGFGGEGGPWSEEEPESLPTCPSAGGSCAATKLSAAEFLVQSARALPGEVVFLSFSSLTDVALAALLEPNLPWLIKSLVVMGGALYSAGNVSPLAEANFARDAAATQAVFQAFGGREAFARDGPRPAPVVLAPLDVTLQALVTPGDLLQAGASGGASAKLWAKAAGHYRKSYCEIAGICGGIPLHDAHTVAFLLEPGLYTNISELSIEVIVTAEEGRTEHGMSVVDRRAQAGRGGLGERQSRVQALLGVDGERYVRSFLEHLALLP